MNPGVMFGYRHGDLSRFNRPVRVRMPGVGGLPVIGRPYPDWHRSAHEVAANFLWPAFFRMAEAATGTK